MTADTDTVANVYYLKVPASPTAEAVQVTETETHERASFAYALTGKLFEWLLYSPANPTYTQSDAYKLPKAWLDNHWQEIDTYIGDQLPKISMGNAAIDLYQLKMIHKGDIVHRNQYKMDSGDPEEETVEETAKMFTTTDFLEAGIKETLATSRADTAETSAADINDHAVRAIGAMLIRGVYLTRLSESNRGAFSEQERDGFLAVFRQNIVSTVQAASRLENIAQAPRNELQSVPPTSEPVEAAA